MKQVDETNIEDEDLKDFDNSGYIDKDNVDNAEDLAKEKRNINEFNVSDNNANVQIFIQNLDHWNTNITNTNTTKSESAEIIVYNLCVLDDCTKFIEKYKYSEYLAVAIVLSTFEIVSLRDLPSLKAMLFDQLPREEILESEVVEKFLSGQNPYISLNTIIKIISGEKYLVGKEEYVGLGKDSKHALVNIWDQFPALHKSIISWLFHIIEINNHTSSYDTYLIGTAFERVISLDFTNAKNEIFPKLYLEQRNTGLLGIIGYKLYVNSKIKYEMQDVLIEWIKAYKMWLWRPTCLIYMYCMNNNDYFALEPALSKAILDKLTYLSKNDLRFIAMLIFKSKQFRMMIINIFGIQYKGAQKREERIKICRIYLNLVRYCYYLVDAGSVELPLVSCDTKEQQYILAPILSQIIYIYSLRKELYVILEAYIKEISNYKYTENVTKHLGAFFFNLGITGEVYKDDVINFLKGCNNKIAKQIYEYLI